MVKYFVINKVEQLGGTMKTVYLIGGTMGVGKTTVCQYMKTQLSNSVFLDGDWCWDAHPFQVTEETKRMVLDNICYLLNNFIRCTAYDHVIFCWVMHEQSIIDSILERMDAIDCNVKIISLIADEENIKKRLTFDVSKGIRTEDVIDRSIARIDLYKKLDTTKVDTSNKTIQEISEEILIL